MVWFTHTRTWHTSVLGLCALLAFGHGARATDWVQWPQGTGGDASGQDPIATVRWSATVAWTTPQPAGIEPLLRNLNARLRATPDSALLLAYRAVALRTMGRFEEATATLEQALSQDRNVLDDPDVGLTRAFLAAQTQHFEQAVIEARKVLPRIAGTREMRTELSLDIARWSMARGPEGLDDALVILTEVAMLGTLDPMVRATLALALARKGHTDEAREVARGGLLPSGYSAVAQPRRGALLPGEGDAAVGIAFWLSGRMREAIDPLARASSTVSTLWRAPIIEALASARRAISTAPLPPAAHVAHPLQPRRIRH